MIRIDPKPTYELSPYLFMQFMEPLGTTDSSVEAAWDFQRDQWKPEFIEVIKELSPSMIRWGGILTSFWKWREGIGPRDRRIPMINYLWGGLESNQVGLHEYMDFCEQVGAEPLLGVNFSADGRPEYINTVRGENRAGTPEEAAALVRYCNDPDDDLRKVNGKSEPWGIRFWQVGNETSYPKAGHRFTSEESAKEFVKYAKAMRQVDPEIKLIGWGCKEGNRDAWWAPELLDIAGDQVDYVAAHMMCQGPRREDTILTGMEYMKDRDRAWAELLEIYDILEPRLLELEAIIKEKGSDAKIAITEGHLSLKPHNTCFLLHEWLAGLYHAKVLNLYQRHGDMVKIATLADFFGNRWTVNAVMLGSPMQRMYLMPVGIICSFYRKHIGEYGVAVPSDLKGLDMAISRTDNRLYLHVINGDLHRANTVDISIEGHEVVGGCAYTIAPGIDAYVDSERRDTFAPEETRVNPGDLVNWTFPGASVTVLELEIKPKE